MRNASPSASGPAVPYSGIGVAVLTASLMLANGACAARRAPARPESIPAAEPGAGSSSDRRILVTINSTEPSPIRDSGSTSGPYIAPSEYTVSERTRRAVVRLARKYGLREVEGWPIPALDVHCVVFEIPPDGATDDVIDRLNRDPLVDLAQPMNTFEVQGNGYDDPYVGMQHGMEAMGVWDVHPSTRGRGVIVAVVDTGVHVGHPDLAGSVSAARDFVVDGTAAASQAEGHGTAVAGVIAARSNNGIGIVGVAPDAQILALRACWETAGARSNGTCNSFTLAKALSWALDHGPNVINLSLAGPHDPLIEKLIRAALERNITVVAAAEQWTDDISFPGSVEGVLAARSSDHEAASGRPVTMIGAPGQDILAATPENGFDFVSGSSFAAAHVSGVVALLLERSPELSPEEIRNVLQSTSRASTGDRTSSLTIIDACAALTRVAPDASCRRPATAAVSAPGD